VTVGDKTEEEPVNCGAPAAMIRLARAWARDELPLTGSFCPIPGTGARGNPAIAFLAEPPLG
jgi:hypothetical protein